MQPSRAQNYRQLEFKSSDEIYSVVPLINMLVSTRTAETTILNHSHSLCIPFVRNMFPVELQLYRTDTHGDASWPKDSIVFQV